MRGRLVILIAALISLAAAAPALAAPAAIKSPAEYLGFEIGADRKLADYEQARGYFELLDEASPWVTVERIGTTTLGKPMIAVILSTPANLEKLDRYLDISRRLADPRKLTSAEADALIKEARIIAMITPSLHATEVGAAQMTLELAYDVAAGQNERLSKALEQEILYIVPTNPDGMQMVVDWYKKWLGTEFEGCSMPWLYHYYAGHDDNRDWFMLNLAETRAVFDLYFKSVVPQAVLDMHQQQSNGARLFLPPYYPPGNRNVDPVIYRAINLIGASMQLACEERGLSGVISNASYDAYWEGSSNQVGWWHNQIGLLSEAASVNVASPIFIEPGELRGDEVGFARYEMMLNFPNPWPGGWWRLRDIVDYDFAAAESFIETCADNREHFLENYYHMGLKAIERGKAEKPFAYVIPAPQRDPVTAARLAEALMLGGVEVHRAAKDFMIGDRLYRAGSFVVRLDQPYGRYAKDLLEVQEYPDTRASEKQPLEKPYDVTGWTMPLQMGVGCDEINEHFEAPLDLLTEFPYPAASFRDGAWGYALRPEINASYQAANELLAKGFAVRRLDAPGALPAGTFIVPAQKGLAAAASELAPRAHADFLPLDGEPSGAEHDLRPVKTALFKPWIASMDEGWTRLLFDSFKVPYANVSNKDVKENKIKGYDILVIPSIQASIIKDGKIDDPEEARWFRPMPPEYRGGIDKKGIENVKKFVEGGGTLICFGISCEFAIETFELPVRNILNKVSSDDFYCPGSILKVAFKTDQPVTYGMSEKGYIYFANSLAFATSVPYGKFDRSVLASFADKEPLASGLLIGGERLYRNAALVEYKVGAGRVVLF
ncbi:MAG: M14 family zinc carboxypeptidase, partial [Candidatus Krumholzibacteria bacterium]|nr:M14 family zinc carboxypeptidase [Candidatus Krumholzibacteria bacterium]